MPATLMNLSIKTDATTTIDLQPRMVRGGEYEFRNNMLPPVAAQRAMLVITEKNNTHAAYCQVTIPHIDAVTGEVRGAPSTISVKTRISPVATAAEAAEVEYIAETLLSANPTMIANMIKDRSFVF